MVKKNKKPTPKLALPATPCASPKTPDAPSAAPSTTGHASPNVSDLDSHTSDGHTSDGSQQEHPVAQGVLADGKRFAVPETVSVMRQLVHPRSFKSPAVQLWALSSILTAATLYLGFTGALGSAFFIAQFVFWRLGYNVGLGVMLAAQSKSRALEKLFTALVGKTGFTAALFEKCIVFRDNTVPKYKVKDYPLPFNAWMLFRIFVKIILANDLIAYFVMVGYEWKAPDFSQPLDIGLYAVGTGLIVFGLWSKADAHRVIGDYAWYWGDFFFLLDKSLVFDGIFDMFPHPMYTVGYAFMYGFTLMSKSHTVFYWSVFGHLAQMVFLVAVENPHIDKTYNSIRAPTEEERARDAVLYDGEQGFFERRELVVMKNFSIRRAADVTLVLLMGYSAYFTYVNRASWALVAGQYVAWRLLLTVGLGGALFAQSRWKSYTNAFGSARRAFDNWKHLYNTAVSLTNFSFLLLTVSVTNWAPLIDGTASQGEYTAALAGALLIAVNLYVSLGVYDVVGDFGYFYGDFFIDDVPQRLHYTGIYRYLNNPDSAVGLAAYYGCALISQNLWVFGFAVGTHVMVKLFEVIVEGPHMRRKYGRTIRSRGGIRAAIDTRAKSWRASLKRRQTRAKEEYDAAVQKMQVEVDRRKATYDAIAEKVTALGKSPLKERRTAKPTAKPAGKKGAKAE